MKAYKVEVLVLDHEDTGPEDITTLIENHRYLSASVMSIEGRDIGEWDDSHPLNHHGRQAAEFKRLFGAEAA